MLRIPFILSILAAVMLLVACPPVDPPTCDTNPELPECQPLPCEDEPDGCQEPELTIEIDLPPAGDGNKFPTYNQAERIVGTMLLTLNDPDKVITTQSGVFLNTVKCLTSNPPEAPCRDVDQIDIRDMFDIDNSTIEPDLQDKTLYTAAELRAGLEISLDAKVNSSFANGLYSLVIQVFNCSQTDPVKVGNECADDRLGLKGYRFQVQ